MKTNTAITHYKKSIVDRAEHWTRYVIPRAFWEARKAANVVRSGLLEADAVSCYIQLSLVTEDPEPGDIIVKGEIERDIDSAFTAKTLMETEEAFVVKSADLKDYGSSSMHHWQLGGS